MMYRDRYRTSRSTYFSFYLLLVLRSTYFSFYLFPINYTIIVVPFISSPPTNEGNDEDRRRTPTYVLLAASAGALRLAPSLVAAQTKAEDGLLRVSLLVCVRGTRTGLLLLRQ